MPLTYIISPDFKLVGLARGAINWERREVLAAVRSLLKINKIENKNSTVQKKASKKQIINLDPPIMKLIAPKAKIKPNSWVPFEVSVKWHPINI